MRFVLPCAVHYVEAVVYAGVNPYSMPKLALHKLTFTIGPKLREKPWCRPVLWTRPPSTPPPPFFVLPGANAGESILVLGLAGILGGAWGHTVNWMFTSLRT
jgi:hypothetical protein